jgi:D-alanine-D-alanine ligase
MSKLKVAVIFGGRSGEHEVSLVSAASVIEAIDKDKYELVEIGITEDGRWLEGDGCLKKFKNKDYSGLDEVLLSTRIDSPNRLGIVFPVLHGPFGEDGTMQGLLEMLRLPYVGCNTLASSTAMDKLQCKAIWEAAGLPVVPYIGFNKKAWAEEKEKILKDIEKNIGMPCFVKPANMGSSVGISKVKELSELEAAIDLAAKYDRRILVENGLEVREIECAVIGNDDVEASPLGEVIVGGEFYDFYDKYVNGVSMTEVPAQIDKDLSDKIRGLCVKSFKVLDCCGLARVDCFIDKKTGEVYLNEINTMPGFTSISMYPKMMEAHGFEYSKLIDRLIELGLERFEENQNKQISFESGSNWYSE